MTREDSLLEGLIEDGRPLLMLTAVALLLSGAFAVLLAARREFLPHDIAYPGMSASDLCTVADCRVVRFMFHDRVAFGGALIAIAVLYLWLTAYPLRAGEQWAWRALAVSGAFGFASFLAYLGSWLFRHVAWDSNRGLTACVSARPLANSASRRSDGTRLARFGGRSRRTGTEPGRALGADRHGVGHACRWRRHPDRRD
jgi:hypothetical protein